LRITIKLRGPLSKYGPGEEKFEYNINSSSCTIEELLNMLNVPTSPVLFVTVDGNKVKMDTELRGGEIVTVYPKVAGG